MDLRQGSLSCVARADRANSGGGILEAEGLERWSVTRGAYSCGALVVLKQAAESLTADDVAVVPIHLLALVREEESVAFALMVSFMVIVAAPQSIQHPKRCTSPSTI